MPQEMFQTAVFTILAALSGAVLGWWISESNRRTKATAQEQELSGLRHEYEVLIQENNRLRKQLKHTEQNRAKAISLLDASNDYGYILQTKKELENSRTLSAEHLAKLRQQEEHIVRLTSMLRSIQADGDDESKKSDTHG